MENKFNFLDPSQCNLLVDVKIKVQWFSPPNTEEEQFKRGIIQESFDEQSRQIIKTLREIIMTPPNQEIPSEANVLPESPPN